MIRFGEPVLDVVRLANHVEADLTRPSGVTVARLLGELDTVVGQDRMVAVGHGFHQMFEELPGGSPVSLIYQRSDRELARGVDADEQV